MGGVVREVLPFDGERTVSVYLPSRRAEAVVYAGDGAAVAEWGADVEAAVSVPAAIVGVHGLADEWLRLEEYSPVFDPERFADHERFVVDDVRRWAAGRFGLALPIERTAIFGASAGGELAVALGLRHPDVYGAILAGSPGGGYRPPATLPGRLPRACFVAGAEEPFFLENAERWARAFRDAGGDVTLIRLDGGHGDPLWRAAFPSMVGWAFR